MTSNFFESRMLGLALVIVVAIGAQQPGQAHEHRHTHHNLTLAAFRFLDSDFLRTADFGGLTEADIEFNLAQGVIDEDECIQFDGTGGRDANGMERDWGEEPQWNSHFYHAKTGKKLEIVVPISLCKPTLLQQNAADRALMLWNLAVEDYHDAELLLLASNRTRAREEFSSAFRILGRVLHLLEDMTSPAHVHDDPHGQANFLECGGDSDDFERWGYCEQIDAQHIYDYFYDPDFNNCPIGGCSLPPSRECVADFDRDGVKEDFGMMPRGFKCQLWAPLQILYDGRPQGTGGSADPVPRTAAVARTFLDRVANVSYDFTAFHASLKNTTLRTDIQDASELKAMLNGSGEDDCGIGEGEDVGLCEAPLGWWITGNKQDIGRTTGNCGSVEHAVGDFREEWWIDAFGCVVNDQGFDYFINGFAYIENIGGEGADGNGDRGPFIPLRYGCPDNNTSLCKGGGPRSKPMFRELYGSHRNRRAIGMPRIQGDILYTTAVAYAAGLIQTFLDTVNEAPIADAGGPYVGEACQNVTFDASASSDANGTIEAYEWDFTDDGDFDVNVSTAIHNHVYEDAFTGNARVRVTDDEGFTGEDLADVDMAPDTTPPTITALTAEPSHLWPPNKNMIPVTLTVETDDLCEIQCGISAITSNMPEMGQTDHTAPDWTITGPLSVDLRSEQWHGNSPEQDVHVNRAYNIALECADAAGNTTGGEIQVAVSNTPPTEQGQGDQNDGQDTASDQAANNQVTDSISASQRSSGAFGPAMIAILLLLLFGPFRAGHLWRFL
jgi:hypothetical protein